MNILFLIIELFSYSFAVFLFIKKKELAIIYIPVLIYSNVLIEPTFPAFLYYGTVSFLILTCIIRNRSFYRNNIYAILLFIYFIILLPRSSDLVLIRPHVFSVLWLFLSIPLITSIYQHTSKDVIFKELSNCALIILILFTINVLVSTKFGFSPRGMYGITKGILYGNLYGAGFNITSSAIFIVVLKSIEKKSYFYSLILLLSFFFILLSLRRSVIMVSALGAAIGFLTLLTQKEARKFIFLGCIIFLIGYGIYSSTAFMNQFNERYELRKLNDREIEEEKRLFEYELIYNDMFVYKDYSPWYGSELLNSAGKYGKGVFELRTLHADLPSIAHSSGIIGLVLYLLMIITAWKQSWRSAQTSYDKLIILYWMIAITVYTITGRFTEAGSMMLLFLILLLPLAENKLDLNQYSDEDDLTGNENEIENSYKSNHLVKI